MCPFEFVPKRIAVAVGDPGENNPLFPVAGIAFFRGAILVVAASEGSPIEAAGLLGAKIAGVPDPNSRQHSF